MHRSIRTAITGALLLGGVAGLVTVSSVGGGASPAGDLTVDPAPFVDRTPFGTLEVRTDPTGQLSVRVTEIGKAPVTVPFSPGKQDRCKVDTAALGPYVGLQVVSAAVTSGGLTSAPISPAPQIGLVDNGLGSRDQNNCNRSNGRIEAGQGLEISLGTMFENVLVDYADLDIEAKFGADMYYRTSLTGAPVNLGPIPLVNKSDNDADSFGSDNNLIPIGAKPAAGASTGPADDDFDRLLILPTSADGRGQVSLEGGGDYANVGMSDANRTVLHLVRSKTYEYTLVCYVDGSGVDNPNPDGTIEYIEETPAAEDWNIDITALANSGYPAKTRVFRYAGVDADGNAKPCDPIGAGLSADAVGTADSVLLEPSTANVNLRVELTWVIPKSKLGTTPDPFARTIDVDPTDAVPEEPARFCASFSGDPWSPANPAVPVHPTYTDGSVVPWCVLSDTRTVTATGDVIQTMIWDGLGDPKWY